MLQQLHMGPGPGIMSGRRSKALQSQIKLTTESAEVESDK